MRGKENPLYFYIGYWKTESRPPLVAVQPPVLQLLLEQRAADTGGVVQLPGPVVVQHLGKHTRVPAVLHHSLKYLFSLSSHRSKKYSFSNGS